MELQHKDLITYMDMDEPMEIDVLIQLIEKYKDTGATHIKFYGDREGRVTMDVYKVYS